MGFSTDGKFLAIGIEDCAYVWNTLTWKLDLCYQKRGSVILSVSWDACDRLYFGCNMGWLTVVTFGDKVRRSLISPTLLYIFIDI